ncbi:hypothetical protein LVJ94_14115 [Pendulispora rubella]|uniref:RING-type E3 ubiquitin transferase n=1 Tax=Pendulispora rubella TaxID=2741070 RepID=A0ABZ2LEQ9_9BACT
MPTFPLFDGDAIWVLAGLSILVTALIAAGRALQQGARQRRILRARETTIAEAREGELVIVRGRARGGHLVPTPITKKDALWTRLIVRGEVARPGLLRVQTLHREVQSANFVVEASTGRFEVEGTTATVVVGPDRIDRSYTAEGAQFEARILPLFQKHTDFGVLEGDKAVVAVRTFEESLLPGDEVAVIGIARRSGADVRIAPSRDGLFVVQGDIQSLAQSGAIWREIPDA